MSRLTHQSSLWQVLGLYAGGSWVVLQVVDVLAQNISLPPWVFTLTLALLLIGLPITAATAYFQGIGRTASRHADGRGAAAGEAHATPSRGPFTWGNVLKAGVAALAVWGVAVTGWLLDVTGTYSAAFVLTAAVSGAYVALHDAVSALKLPSWPLRHTVAAVSAGVVKGRVVLDLNYEEDAKAEVDLNVAMTGEGHYIDVQGTAESNPFDDKTLQEIFRVARLGVAEITTRQRMALES